MATRKERRRRRIGPANSHTPNVTRCAAEDCTAFPFDRVTVPAEQLHGEARTVAVCAEHARLLRIQIARNENDRVRRLGGQAEDDLELVQRMTTPRKET